MHRFDNALLNALFAVCLVAPWVAFLSLPVFDGGVFPKTETVAFGLHSIAALAGFLLLFLSIRRGALIISSAKAGAFGFAAIAVSAALTSPFSEYAPRDWYGALDRCVGVLWYMETAILAVTYTVVWSELPRRRILLTASSFLVLVACAFLQLIDINFHGKAFSVEANAGYLGLLAVSCAIPAFSLSDAWARLVCAVLALACVVVSGSVPAYATVLVALAFFLLRGSLSRPLPSTLTTLFVVLGSAALLYSSAPVQQRLAIQGARDVSDDVASKAAIDRVSMQTLPFAGLWRSSIAERMVVKDLNARPDKAFLGSGFGAFDTISEAQRREAPGRLHDVRSPGSSLTYWNPNAFTSMPSQAVEVLVAAGVLGLVAWLAFVTIAGIAYVKQKGRLAPAVLLALTAAGLTFGALPSFASPFLALAFAAGISSAETNTETTTRVREALATLCVAACATLAAGAAFLSFFSLKGEAAERVLFPSPVFNCEAYKAVTMPAEDVNESVVREIIHMVKDLPEGDARTARVYEYRFTIANYSCVLRKGIEQGRLAPLLASLDLRSSLDASLGRSNKVVPAILRPDFDHWNDDIDLLLDRAKGRTDYVVPYIAWLAAQDRDAAGAKARFLTRTSEHDPVNDWLSQETGSPNMRQALDHGFANLFEAK